MFDQLIEEVRFFAEGGGSRARKNDRHAQRFAATHGFPGATDSYRKMSASQKSKVKSAMRRGRSYWTGERGDSGTRDELATRSRASKGLSMHPSALTRAKKSNARWDANNRLPRDRAKKESTFFGGSIGSIRLEAKGAEKERRKLAAFDKSSVDHMKRMGRQTRAAQTDPLKNRADDAGRSRSLGRYPASTHISDKHLFKTVDTRRAKGKGGFAMSTGSPRRPVSEGGGSRARKNDRQLSTMGREEHPTTMNVASHDAGVRARMKKWHRRDKYEPPKKQYKLGLGPSE